MWGDLHLDGAQPYALFRESTTKDKDKRAVPLRRELADELRRAKPEDVSPTKRVFWFAWPTYDILRGDLKRAKIERKDGLGRVVHFHSFRKTWQTLGVRYGINQRAAQEVLGHSDANLTAKVYTDVPALALHDEIAKLPWISEPGDHSQTTLTRTRRTVSGGVTRRHPAAIAGFVRSHWHRGNKSLLGARWRFWSDSKNGCPGWDRTSDQVINSHLLCH